MKLGKKVYSLICDDVRHEIGGKNSYMGVYGKDIIIEKIPALFAKLIFVIVIENANEALLKKKSHVTLKMPGVDPVIFLNPLRFLKASHKMTTNIFIGLSPFKIEREGKAKFELYIADEEKPSLVHEFIITVQGGKKAGTKNPS